MKHPVFRWIFGIFLSNWHVRCSLKIEKKPVFNVGEILPCITNITKPYQNRTVFLFISDEIRMLPQPERILQSLEGTIEIHTSDDFTNTYGFFVFFPNLMKSYKRILEQIQSHPNNRFLIILPTLFNISSMHNLMAQFWEFKMLEVLVLNPHKRGVDMYSYDPFTESSCNEPKIVKTNSWNARRREFENAKSLHLFDRKLGNLNLCKVMCFAKNRPPDSIVAEEGDGSWKLDGIGGKLMEEVRKRMNFTSKIGVPKLDVSVDKYGYDISNGFPELVASLFSNFSIDLAFGIYSHIIYDNEKTQFSSPAVSECYGFAVPAHSGKEISAWMYYTKEFELFVWLLILLEYVLSVAILKMALQILETNETVVRAFNFVEFYVFSVNLGLSAVPRIRNTRIRILIGLMLVYSLVVQSAYQSSLGSFLTVPWKREQINTFAEILDAGYQGRSVPQGKRILERFSADNVILNRISQRFQVHKQHFDSLIRRIQKEKDIVTFGAQRFIQFYISNELNSTGRDDVYLLPKCVIRAHASPFLFKKGSPFSKPINKIVLAAVESGLTKFWYTYSTPPIFSRFSEITPLTFHQLESAFNLLIIGYIVSVITFTVEILKSKTIGKQHHAHKGSMRRFRLFKKCPKF